MTNSSNTPTPKCNLQGKLCRKKQEKTNQDCPGCCNELYDETGIKTISTAIPVHIFAKPPGYKKRACHKRMFRQYA